MNTRILFLIPLFLFYLTAYGKEVQDVNVTNPSVPVQGVVTVGNDLSSPVPVTSVDSVLAYPRIPWQAERLVDLSSGTGENLSRMYDVPPEMIAVIEYAHARGPAGCDDNVAVGIRTTVDGVEATHHFSLPIVGGVRIADRGPGQLRLYASPQTSIWADSVRPTADCPDYLNIIMTVSGYLVPVGSPSLAR